MNILRLEEKPIGEVKGETGVAAFFDLDGTVVALPSLERRFFETLRYQRAIPCRNYWRWIREALRLAPRGLGQAAKANKMYLRGVASKRAGASWFYAPTFFKEAVARAAWHAREGHFLVMVSGTLEPLAERAARALEAELAARQFSGSNVAIRVCATRLEESAGHWTGRILGEAMFAEAKARAVKRIAKEMRLDLALCFAYGDSVEDRWLLDAVGKPATVNASAELKRIAEERNWVSLEWSSKAISTQKTQRSEIGEKRESLHTEETGGVASQARTKAVKARANG